MRWNANIHKGHGLILSLDLFKQYLSDVFLFSFFEQRLMGGWRAARKTSCVRSFQDSEVLPFLLLRGLLNVQQGL